MIAGFRQRLDWSRMSDHCWLTRDLTEGNKDLPSVNIAEEGIGVCQLRDLEGVLSIGEMHDWSCKLICHCEIGGL